MKILFFIVHPAKFWMFRDTTNTLIKQGHDVEWAIVTKDILEDLVKSEGWKYSNIFPEGRRIKGLPIIVGTFVNMLKTVYRLFKLTRGKKYDLFVTSDILSFVGWVKHVPTLVFQDDDFAIVKEYAPIWFFATKVATPVSCDLGPMNYKRLPYKGSHKWAYTNPKYFKPNKEVVKKFNPKGGKYFLLRLVSMTASHDRGKKGLSDENAKQLVDLLSKYGKVFISSEKPLMKSLEKYRIQINPKEIHHAMYYADMFIGDSQSMISEAGLLATPAIRFNDFAGRIGYLREEESYGLSYSFNSSQFPELIDKVKEILKMKDAKGEWRKRVNKYGKEHIDSTQFYIDLIESYDPKRKSKK